MTERDVEKYEKDFTEVLKANNESTYRAECKQDPDSCDKYCHLQGCPKQFDPVKIVRGVPVEVIRRSRLVYPRQRRDRSE